MATEGLMRRLAGSAGRVLFPHFCLSCGTEGRIICRQCLDEVSAPLKGVFSCPVCGRAVPLGLACPGACRRRSALDGAVAMAPYGQPILRGLVQAYKYEGVAEAGAALAEIFGAFIRRQRSTLIAVAPGGRIVPVPLHYFRLARRGFNQADILADAAGRGLGLEVETGLLRRRFRWRSQVGLEVAAKRRRNAVGSVYLRPGATAAGAYLIIDDVLTTGSTAADCARVLKSAGASRVWALTLLRG